MNLQSVMLALASTAAAGGALLLAGQKAKRTAEATAQAIATGGAFKARLTGYWPFSAKDSERQMEGGIHDRRSRPLHTLEQHQRDPAAHPFVSVSGDDAIFPYGQRLSIDTWPGSVFRVVDTGGHFRGARKVYRVTGSEPLDICVDSSKTKVIPNASVQIIKGDHFDKPGKEVAASGFQGQRVAIGGDLDLLDAEL